MTKVTSQVPPADAGARGARWPSGGSHRRPAVPGATTTPARRLRGGLAALVGSAEPSAADLAR